MLSLDFKNLVKSNPDEFHTLWDYCCCLGKQPHEVYYPKMKCDVAKWTFNFQVYKHARKDQIERQAKMTGLGAVAGAM